MIVLGPAFPSRGKNKCEGPGAGVSLARLQAGKEARAESRAGRGQF